MAGALLSPPRWLLPWIAAATCAYAAVYGFGEVIGLPLRAPGRSWQVPAIWLNTRALPLRVFIWGGTLGSGLLTRNPYAGMWLLPPLLALAHSVPLAALVGLAHGVARGIGILRNTGRCTRPGADMRVWMALWRWRLADGAALLFAAGLLLAYIGSTAVR